MDSTQYWFEERIGEQKEEMPTQDVLDIIDLYNLLKPLEKVTFKKIIRDIGIF